MYTVYRRKASTYCSSVSLTHINCLLLSFTLTFIVCIVYVAICQLFQTNIHTYIRRNDNSRLIAETDDAIFSISNTLPLTLTLNHNPKPLICPYV